MPASRASRRSPSRSLAEDVRSRSDEELRDLVRSRPDLARPAPADLTSLAARSSTRASLQRALDTLDRGHLQVIEALLVTGEPDERQTAALMGISVSALRPFLDRLWRIALLWRSPEGLRVVRTVAELIGPHPAGIGPPAADLRAGDSAAGQAVTTPAGADLEKSVAMSSPEARAILDRLTWGPPVGVLTPEGPLARAGRELVTAGLLVPTADDQVMLPREVALHLRHGRLHREPRLEPPPAPSHVRAPESVDSAAGAPAAELLGHLDELAEEWGARPPRVLRAGGLAVRDLKRLGAVLDLPVEHAAFVAEMGYAAGLLADDGALEPSWAPTPAYDEWQQQPGERRWCRVAAAWLASSRAPSLVGSNAVGSGTVNALSAAAVWPAGRQRRADVLRELATLAPGAAPGIGVLEDRIRWRRPLRLPEGVETRIDVVLREADWVGVTGGGALSAAGRLLLEDDLDAATAAMAEHLPAPVEEILLQADLTAIAPGRLDGSLARFMRLASDVESRGGATVFRFSPDSLRRVFDAGWSAAQVLQTLSDASRTPVPQPLDYLVHDVARRHGQTRVGSVSSYVRSDDGAVLDAMAADRGLRPLRLRRIAPTVLVSPAPATTTLEMLRDNGFTPAAESPEGGIVVPAASRHRTPPRRAATSPVQVTRVDDDYSTTLVAALRAGEEATAYRRQQDESRVGPRLPASDPTVTLALLREAVADHLGVWIGYVDATGSSRRILLRPSRVEGGRVLGSEADSDVQRSFSIHRITGAALA
ncbi:helicase-associated domain-containing protein [Segeticoccus rhizosphaerae]|uniref:helicase-associated domain-containing protein n=1 Tax=Segeticoccus rhizosphaerae TaxID=1104777 RepID=UPI0010C0756F|nr:helicase-associated domain-containing protein [Ornithinicoccus soli]